MKSVKAVVFLLFVFLIVGLSSCGEEDLVDTELQIPSKFSVDIPSAISSSTATGLGSRIAVDDDGVIEGEDIYAALPYFIRLGEASAEIIELTLVIAAVLEVANVDTYTYVDEEDGRSKRIDLVENVTRGGATYEYELIVTDIEEDDLALQLLWNSSAGVEGVGILKPYNINRLESGNDSDAFYRIDYSEVDPDYEATMLVSLSGISLDEDGNGTVDESERGNIDNLKMFVGRNGDVVEIRGNSNHPQVTIIDPEYTGGRNYAFVGRGNDVTNIGVVELALPPSSVSTEDVLDTYSVFNVLNEEIDIVFDRQLDQSIIDAVLAEAGAPAYFNESGFISAGEALPDGFSADFSDLSSMRPFAPAEVSALNMNIRFLE